MKTRTGYIYQTATGAWRARFRIAGKDQHVQLEAKTREEAEAETAEHAKLFAARDSRTVCDTLRGALHRIESTGGDRPEMSLEDAWRVYTAHRLTAGTKPLTVQGYGAAWRRFQSWAAERGITGIHQVTDDVAVKYVDDLDASPNTRRTNDHAMITLRLVWSRATKATNPWRGIRPVRMGHAVAHRAFTIDQLRDVLAKAPADVYGEMMWIAAYTGLRYGDVAALDASEVLPARGMIETMPGKTEHGYNAMKARIAIHKAIHDVIMVRRAGRTSGPLFPERPSRWVAMRVMADVLKAAGIEKLADRERGVRRACVYGWHSFRFTVQTQLIEAGVHGLVADAILAHRSGAGLGQHYTDLSDKAIIEAMNKALPDLRPESGKMLRLA